MTRGFTKTRNLIGGLDFMVYSICNMKNQLFSWMIGLLPLALPLYVVRFDIGLLPTTALEIFILLLIAVWLMQVKFTGLKNAWTTLGVWRYPLTAWLAATLLSVLIAPDPWSALGHWRAFMLEPALIFALLLERYNNSEHLKATQTKNLLSGLTAVTILMGAYAIYQFFTGFGIPSPWDASPGRRATGVFGFPNGLSLFMAPFGVTCFIFWLKKVFDGEGGRLRLALPIAWALAGAAEILAKSMGGLLAFGIGTVLVLLAYKKTRLIGLGLSLIGLIGAGLVAFNIYQTELHPQTLEHTVASTKKWSSMVRTIIWKESLDLALSNPILGSGLRSYKTAVVPYHTATWMEVYPHPHNIFLMLWIETGLAGLLAFIWIIITWTTIVTRGVVTRTTTPRRTSQSSYVNQSDAGRATRDVRRFVWLIPLIVILVHGMVDMPYFKNDLALQFWILAALAAITD